MLDAAREAVDSTRAAMIALHEELDWRCYRLDRVLDDAPEYANPPPLRPGERAFEIFMARRIAAGELESTWFTRHSSTSSTEPPQHWAADYRAIVERRIALIESNPTIGLIERPEYKRRWSSEPWETLEREALRDWLLDQLDDARYWPAAEPRLISTHARADAARADWEATWEKQREEDAIDDAVAQKHGDAMRQIAEREARDRKQRDVGRIPVPPKYRPSDFLSTGFWRLRGGLDVPKERFVSFPHCARNADGSLPVLWAGYDHLAAPRRSPPGMSSARTPTAGPRRACNRCSPACWGANQSCAIKRRASVTLLAG